MLRRPNSPDFRVVLANPTPGKCSTTSPAANIPDEGYLVAYRCERQRGRQKSLMSEQKVLGMRQMQNFSLILC